MSHLFVELISPEAVFYSTQANTVVVPGTEGEFGVLLGHAPFISTIQPGVVYIENTDGKEKRVFVSGGFAEVNDTVCRLLVDGAQLVSDIDPQQVEQQIQDAKEILAYTTDEIAKGKAAKELVIAEAKLDAVRQK